MRRSRTRRFGETPVAMLALPLLVTLATAAPPLALPAAAEIVVTANIEPRTAYPREAATLVVTVQGSQAGKRPAIASVPGLEIRYLGPSTQVSIVNGSMSASVSHRLFVSGERPGTYEIGPIRVDVDGKIHDAGTVKFEILAPGSAPRGAEAGDDTDLDLTLSTARTEVYVHERIPIDIVLSIGAVRVDDLQYPQIESESFAVGGFGEPRQRRVGGPNGSRHLVEFATTVTPLKQGSITLGPATMQLRKAVPGRRRSPFGGIFGDEMQPVDLVSDAITLDVKPLPSEGRPEGFSGAVGQFRLETTVTPRDVAAGDPVTITTKIVGNGSLDGVTLPEIAESDVLRAYPVQNGKTDRADERVFEQVVIPKREGKVAIHGPRFSYFDPLSERYVTVGGAPHEIVARASAEAKTAPRIVMETAPGPLGPSPSLGRDLVFIKDAPGKLRPRGTRVWQSPMFWLMQSVPLLAFLAAGAIHNRRARLAGDSRFARYSRAGKTARSGLASARTSLQEGNLATAHDAAATALRDYLAAKLDLPAGAVSELGPARLRDVGVDAARVADVEAFFARCEHARFAPAAASAEEVADLIAIAERVVRSLERSRKIRPLAVAAIAAILSVGAAVAAFAVDATESPIASFYRGNALYGDERYADAAAAYEAALAGGVESGAILYNLGNACFKEGNLGAAVLAYERAAKHIPSDPDLAANLSYARELCGDPQPAAPWYARILFPLASRVSTETLAWLAVACWWSVFALLILRMFVPVAARVMGRAAVAVAIALVATTASLAYRIATVERPRWAVVTSSEDAVIRYEPSETGTAFFVARPGTVVEIQSTRPGWARVQARDGRRGWTERSKISRL